MSIKITITVEEYLDLRIRGMMEFVVVDQEDKEEITSQTGWENICHFEPITPVETQRSVLPLDGNSALNVPNKSNGNSPRSDFDRVGKVLGENCDASPVKWQLWPRRVWAESTAKREQAKASSNARVFAHNAIKERLDRARQALTASGKFSPAQVEFYLSNIEHYPKLKQALGL